MTLQKRFVFLGLAAAVVGGFVYSQIYFHEKNRNEIKDIAAELAKNWQAKLSLNALQTQKLEDFIIEFTIRKNEIINSDAPRFTMVERLKSVQQKEYKRLKEFMDVDQFDIYVGIKEKYPNRLTSA